MDPQRGRPPLRSLCAFATACLIAAACVAGDHPASESFALASGSHRYLVIASGDLPKGIEGKLAAVGGVVDHSLDDCGVVLVHSASPDFRGKAGKVPGIRSVVPDLAARFGEPFSARFADVDAAAAKAIAGRAGPWSAGPRAQPIAGPPPDCSVWPPPQSEPGFAAQWGLSAIGASSAWSKGFFGQGVRVAVIDSGVAFDPYGFSGDGVPERWRFHPDLAPHLNLDLSTSFVDGEPFYQPAFDETISYHGTHVMGIIGAAVNQAFVVGVAPCAELVAIKVLDDHSDDTTFGRVLAGMCYAATIDADIANLSLGATFPRNGFCDADECISADEVSEVVVAFHRAANNLARHGTTIVASAGNDAIDFDHTADLVSIPAQLPHVINVAATGPVGWGVDERAANPARPASYTNLGQSGVDLAAPGGDFVYPDQDRVCSLELAGYIYFEAPCWALDLVVSDYGGPSGLLWASGTSMAAPHISGLAALLISASGTKLAPAEVLAALRAQALDLGKPGNDADYGQGFGYFGPCTATTCGTDCGTLYDGCGHLIDCGGCGAGDVCRNHRCCLPEQTVCDLLGDTCGSAYDVCSGVGVSCGSCAGSDVCAVHYPGPISKCCTPTECAADGKVCGEAYDATCGQWVSCGTCPDGDLCLWWSGTCCTPPTCAELGRQCGYALDDACSFTWIDCGACPEGTVCNEQAGTCCVPTSTCASVGAQCGSVDDGCGNLQYCDDTCSLDEMCFGTACLPIPPDTPSCGCQDGTMVDYCAPYDGWRCDSYGFETELICTWGCREHGGYLSGLCDSQEPLCAEPDPQLPRAPTPAPPATPGPNRLGCGCEDGTPLTLCVADCLTVATSDGDCWNLCAAHGGVKSTTCSLEDTACTTAATPGPTFVRCYCGGAYVDVCADIVCWSGAEQALCDSACSGNGGLSTWSCIPDDPICVAP